MDKSETISKLRELNSKKHEAKKMYDEASIALNTEYRKRTDDENEGFAELKRMHNDAIAAIRDDIASRRRHAKSNYADELEQINEEMSQIRIAYFREHPDDNLM